MLYNQNGKVLFNAANCTQCGVCLSVCPKNAISAHRGKQTYKIDISDALCVKCGLCISSCAANLLPKTAPEEKKVNEGNCYIACSIDDSVRFFASSGGVCRTLAVEALSSGLVDAVYSLSYSADDDKEIGGMWFSEPPKNNELPQSIYRVVLWGRHILDIPNNVSRIMLIGLPCQLRAANAILRKKKPSLDIVSIAILCRKTKTLGFSRYIARLCGNGDAPLRSIRYRGEGWPGKMRVDGESSDVPFVYHAHCWNLKGCQRCFDSYYMEGDFTVGDPWGIVERGEGEKGQSLLFVHSKAGNIFLDKIKSLELRPLNDKKVSELMGLDMCRIKEREHKSHPNGIFMSRVKKVIGETVLTIKSFF